MSARGEGQQGRNETIAALVEEGELSLAEIGKTYGITRERVRQIANAYHVPDRATQKLIRKILPFQIEVTIRNPFSIAPVCAHGDCLGEVHALELCLRHYFRWLESQPYRKKLRREWAIRWNRANPGLAKEVQARAQKVYALRKAGVIAPIRREPVPKPGRRRGDR